MLTNRINIVLLGVFLAVALTLGVIGAVIAHGEVNFSEATQTSNYQTFSFLNATSTTATSTNITGGGGYFKILGAKKVGLYFSRAWDSTGNAGSTNFKVQVSPDGNNWYDFNKLIQNAATGTVATTLSSVTISAATSTTIVSLDLSSNPFYAVRCIAVRTTDGAATCTGAAEF